MTDEGRGRKALWSLGLVFCQTLAAAAALAVAWHFFGREAEPSYSRTLARVLPSVVGVYGRNAAADDSVGAGVVVDQNYILTSYHLIAAARSIHIDIGGRRWRAQIANVNPEIDIAFLQLAEPADSNPDSAAVSALAPADGTAADFRLTSAAFADSDNLKQGDVVFAVGNPFGLSRSASMGIVSAIGRDKLGIRNFIQTDAAINPGSSGGALANVRGELVGINSAFYADYAGAAAPPRGVGFAVPAAVVRRSLDDFLRARAPAENSFGAEIRPMSARLQREVLDFAPEVTPVMLVSRVWEGTPAAKIGLAPGDIVLTVDAADDSAANISETGALPLSLQSVVVMRGGVQQRLSLPPLEG